MAQIRIGGDPESYMDAPQLVVGGGKKGGGGFIASILDAIGIGRQVAKGPKKSDAQAADSSSSASLPILSQAESAFQPITPLPTSWGQSYLDSINPITTIDPNLVR